MYELGSSLANSFALRIAPCIPSAAGVSTNSAPKAFTILRRSSLNESGKIMINRYPSAAAAKASPMPVFPLVGSMMTVSLLILPLRSASFSMP
ncbi:hypothetical protein D3C85_1198740 [compost metagenome]